MFVEMFLNTFNLGKTKILLITKKPVDKHLKGTNMFYRNFSSCPSMNFSTKVFFLWTYPSPHNPEF